MLDLLPPNLADQLVLKNITPDVVTCAFPFKRFGLIRIGGKGSLVRLSNHSIAVFSPPPLAPAVRKIVNTLSTGSHDAVSYLIAPDIEHYLNLHAWHEAFPNAIIIAPKVLETKLSKGRGSTPPVPITITLPFPTKNALNIANLDLFQAELSLAFFPGYANEIVLLHRASRTLFVADLIFHPPSLESYSSSPDNADAGIITWLFNLTRGLHGSPLAWQRRFLTVLSGSGEGRKAFAESAKSVAGWQFDRIVVCHGDVIEGNAVDVWKRVFSEFLLV